MDSELAPDASSQKRFLIIFVKNPIAGKVKTRIARTMGDEAALRIYQVLLEMAKTTALGVDAERLLCYSDEVIENDAWPPLFFKKEKQADGDLGQRMAAAFARAFALGAHKAVIIGSDCPDLSAEIVRQAYDALDAADVCMGPTLDGGYYLLGMKAPCATLFEGVAWSTEVVAGQTRQKAAAAGLKLAELPQLNDIDEEKDWRQWAEGRAF
ncbi:MAG: TIGR04282 family arsenosugar biosynthesis glycosyltransferase [Saprospiraceae bacterium]